MKISNLLKRLTALIVIAVFLSQPVFAAATYKSRDEIPAKYKWNLTHIYNTEADFEKDMALVENKLIPEIESYKGKLNTKENLLACLKTSTEIQRICRNANDYAQLDVDVDAGDQKAQERLGKVINLHQRVSVATAFIAPEILSKNELVIKAYMKDPAFKDYDRTLDMVLTEKEHSLPEEEQALISNLMLVSQSPTDIYTKLANLDLEFPSVKNSKGEMVEITSGNLGVLMENPDRDFRKAVYEAYYGEYLDHNNTFAATLASFVNLQIFYANAYNYDSAMEAALAPDIPVSVYDNLIASAKKGLPAYQRYRDLSRKVLGLDVIRPYDGNLPLIEKPNEDISYEDAKKIVLEALAPLGEEYIAVLKEAFDGGWIDVYETPGKETGAYSNGSLEHSYVLLNYNGSFYDVSTLAHEMGHAVHQYYSNKDQPFDKSEVTAFTSEVASTLNEILLHKYMIANAKTNQEKLYYMISLLDLYSNTFYNQVRYAEFEKAIYETAEAGNALTADTINTIWRDIVIKYNGDDYEVNDLLAASWARVPHFYYNFYVYQYATSIAASSALADGIIENKPGALEKYTEFLKSGTQYDSITTLANVGVDMKSPKMLDTFINEFDSLVTETERLLKLEGKIK